MHLLFRFFCPPWTPNFNVAEPGANNKNKLIAHCPRVNIEIEGRGETGRAREVHYFFRAVGAPPHLTPRFRGRPREVSGE